jgi:nucleotide-binding universal stress UspA family protein
LERLRREFGDRVEIITHHGRCGEMEVQNITTVPALVIGNLIKFVGLAPKYEDIVTALHKLGWSNHVPIGRHQLPGGAQMTKIIVAVDGSDYGIAAARTAVELAQACHLESLTFVHVVSLKSGQLGTPEYPERPDIPEQWPVFQEPLGIARPAGVMARCEVLYGHPAEQLLHYARQQKVDLIVMGSLGISGIKEFFLGSVASRVVADAPCSVWVVRPGFQLVAKAQ